MSDQVAILPIGAKLYECFFSSNGGAEVIEYEVEDVTYHLKPTNLKHNKTPARAHEIGSLYHESREEAKSRAVEFIMKRTEMQLAAIEAATSFPSSPPSPSEPDCAAPPAPAPLPPATADQVPPSPLSPA